MTIDTQRLATDPEYWRECGAPEDATHAHAVSGRFLRLIAGNWWIWTDRRQEDPFWGCTEWPSVNPEHIIPRPKTASEEWVDGLPAIGEYCEVSVVGQKFMTVEVRGYYNEMVWLSGHGIGQIVEHVSDCRFRTAEQRERDELADFLRRFDKQRSVAWCEDAADAIIADGWTKP